MNMNVPSSSFNSLHRATLDYDICSMVNADQQHYGQALYLFPGSSLFAVVALIHLAVKHVSKICICFCHEYKLNIDIKIFLCTSTVIILGTKRQVN